MYAQLIDSRTNRPDETTNRCAIALITEPGPVILESHIQAIEAVISSRLPDDYRSFLLTTNGGLLPMNSIKVTGASTSPTDVYVLFGIGRGLDTSDLGWNREVLGSQLPCSGLLPIASSASGCPFCLVIDGDRYGSVDYIDLDNSRNVCRVAGSFRDYIAKIELEEVAQNATY